MTDINMATFGYVSVQYLNIIVKTLNLYIFKDTSDYLPLLHIH